MDTINLAAESDRNIIGDDSTPTLTLENSSTGKALKLVAKATANSVGDFSAKSGGAPTVAVLRVGASTASAPAFEAFGSAVVSSASAGATVAFGIRAKFGDVYGWIPVFAEIDA